MMPVDGDLPSAGTECTCVLVGCGGSKHLWHGLARCEHVLGVSLEPIERSVKLSVEETKVETDVGSRKSLPGKGGGNHLWHAECRQFG